ncbi:MAG: hypothetical protein E5X67_18615 [Mesorhizobium sp.]|nr:MAG: hypothetical protein E5X67_18615 [Mesorhizobium sp.]
MSHSLAPPSGLPAISPTGWGDWLSLMVSPIAKVAGGAPSTKLPISPPVGEMAGRPEGGAKEHDVDK